MEHPSEFWNTTQPDKKRVSDEKLEERFKDHAPAEKKVEIPPDDALPKPEV